MNDVAEAILRLRKEKELISEKIASINYLIKEIDEDRFSSKANMLIISSFISFGVLYIPAAIFLTSVSKLAFGLILIGSSFLIGSIRSSIFRRKNRAKKSHLQYREIDKIDKGVSLSIDAEMLNKRMMVIDKIIERLSYGKGNFQGRLEDSEYQTDTENFLVIQKEDEERLQKLVLKETLYSKFVGILSLGEANNRRLLVPAIACVISSSILGLAFSSVIPPLIILLSVIGISYGSFLYVVKEQKDYMSVFLKYNEMLGDSSVVIDEDDYMVDITAKRDKVREEGDKVIDKIATDMVKRMLLEDDVTEDTTDDEVIPQLNRYDDYVINKNQGKKKIKIK